ncbi:peptide transporter [Arachidicoccus ginsenosidimutans]|uniref:ABC transporter permease n=1 Tax=Arachidicoccus sp. BS20 TaxID=1850526 RepID=UPI0007F16AEF|nr:ABC transporter permease [Arachidicoccus sp. BS20]ANI90017.1 peptide transporter [Arachidicoccus sp. BS20]
MNGNSQRYRTLKRLLKNKGACFGLFVIAIALFTAIFAYPLSPDSSPNANRMIPEIANQKPGFSIQFLRIKNQREVSRSSFFKYLLSGKEDDFQLVPIIGFKKTDSGFLVKKYIDEGVSQNVFYSADKILNPAIVLKKFYLGTDKFGRDILSRLIIGTRVSLAVGLIAVIISLTVGVFLGAIAGYFGGRTDNVVMWLINVIWSMPTLLLVFAITILLGKGFWQVFVAVGLTLWVSVARLVRGQILSIKKLEYVEAARVLGFSHVRTIVKHILPNIVGPVMVIAAGNFASAIVIEAGLSFLGLGVQPPQPSWGLMIKENYNFIITNNPMLALTPGIAIMLLVLAFNLLGNGLRDAMDVND